VDPPLRLPHVGWNALQLQRPHPLLTGVRLGADYYFVHSYVVEPTDPADIIATADHGRPFAAVVGRRNVIGMQFHPEKSQTSGLRILENFAQWDGAC
jgi:glutamine amidotransferase